MSTERNSLWIKKSDLYTSKLFQLLQRNNSNVILTSSLRVEDFLFPNTNNKNKEEIKGFLYGTDTRNILNKLIAKRREFKNQRGHINRYLQELTPARYDNYKKNPTKDLKLQVRNIDPLGNLIKDNTQLPGILKDGDDLTSATVNELDNLIEMGYRKLSSANQTTYKKNGNSNKIGGYTTKELIRKSIESQFYWKNSDLSQHGLGSPNDIISLALRALDQRGEDETLGGGGDLPSSVKFLYQLFLPHLDSTSHGAFKTQVNSIRGYVFINKLPIVQEQNKNSPLTFRNNPSYKMLLPEIHGILDDNEAPNSDIAKEYLIILMVDLLENVVRIYKDILKILKKLKADDSFLHMSVEKSIDGLEIFFNNTIKNYFNIDSLYTPYGFAKSRDKKQKPSESANKSGSIRVIGSMETVRDTSRFLEGNYPIQVTKKGDDKYKLDFEASRRNFQEMFLGKQNTMKDAKTDQTIVLGGFIMKTPIDVLSVKILSSAFQDLRQKKDRNIAVTDKIIRAAESHLHINDLLQVKNELFTSLDNVASYTNPTLRDTAFKTAMDEILRRYTHFREAELQDLLATNRFNALLKRYNISKPDNANQLRKILETTDSEAENLVDEIMEAKEKLIVKLSYHQLMAIAYKVISLRVLTILNQESDNIPASYFNTLQSAFQKVDQVILRKLDQSKRGNVDLIKNKLKNSLNTPRLSLNELGAIAIPNLNNRRRNNRRRNNSGMINSGMVNSNIFGNLMVMENAERPEFWDDLERRLRGYTLYLPYTDRGLLGGWGLLDLMAVAKRGKLTNADYISDGSLTEKKYTEEIRPRGYILATERSSDLNKPNSWRAIDRKDLKGAGKLSAKDLRIFLYNLLFSQVVYQKRVKYLWSNDSKGKKNLVKYCKRLVSNRRVCPILMSREKVSGLI